MLPGVTWQGVLRGPALMELAATVRATWLAAYARAADTNAEGRAATANLELRTHAAGADVRLQLTSLLLKLHESAAPSRAHAHLGLFWLRAFDRFRQENTPKVQPRANAHHGARLLPESAPFRSRAATCAGSVLPRYMRQGGPLGHGHGGGLGRLLAARSHEGEEKILEGVGCLTPSSLPPAHLLFAPLQHLVLLDGLVVPQGVAGLSQRDPAVLYMLARQRFGGLTAITLPALDVFCQAQALLSAHLSQDMIAHFGQKAFAVGVDAVRGSKGVRSLTEHSALPDALGPP